MGFNYNDTRKEAFTIFYFYIVENVLSPLMFIRLAEALCEYIENDRPFLGICLGLQLLFESSEEKGQGQC